MFCLYGRFVSTDVLSPRTFFLYGGFVPTYVLSHGRYVSGRYVSGRFVSGCFVPTDVLSPDVLSGHRSPSAKMGVNIIFGIIS